MGYLPVALRNYLVRTARLEPRRSGDLSTEEMIAAFDLTQIGRSPARFDFAKLESLNGHYIRGRTGCRALLQAVEEPCRILPTGRRSQPS